jgi:putative membrane protein
VTRASCFVIALLLCGYAAGQAVLSSADKAFIQQAGIGGTCELQLSSLVDKRSSDPDVRRFAQRMLDDHSRTAAELNAILAHKNVSAPDDIMDPEHTSLKSQLQQLNSADFDRLYMATMVKDHQQALAAFQAEAIGGGDPDVKQFAARQVATIREHLAQAQSIASRYPAQPKQRSFLDLRPLLSGASLFVWRHTP